MRKKTVFLFANSMSYVSDGKSYFDMLSDKYDVVGMWQRGITIWHVHKYIHQKLFGEGHPVIINVGISEAATRNAIHLCYYWLDEIGKHGANDHFMSRTLREMKAAILDFENGKRRYYNMINPGQFLYLTRDILTSLPEFKPIVVGLANPSNSDFVESRIDTCRFYNDILCKMSDLYGAKFINAWGENTIDEAHLTESGHVNVFQSIERIIGNG